MPKLHPYGLQPHTIEGAEVTVTTYCCSACGAPIPEGCFVLARYASADKPTGVKVVTPDGEIKHQCGAQIDHEARLDTGEHAHGQVGETRPHLGEAVIHRLG